MESYDSIIVGAGHNGLVCAAYLARAGQRVLVLERREIVGGAAVTEEIYPGFKFAPCSQGIGWLHPNILRGLQLARHGLEILHPDPPVFTPLPDGRHLTLWRDTAKTAEEIGRLSRADSEKWSSFSARVARLARFLEAVYSATPPRVTTSEPAELLTLLRFGGRLRRLGRRDMLELLRVLPMSVAEFLDEWFESEALKGILGASGINGIFQGPRASGTAYMLLHHHVGSAEGVFRPTGLVRGGIGNLIRALTEAAKQHGAQIRTGTEVAKINVKDSRAMGVTLTPGGEEILARRVISNADPRRTFLGLVDPEQLEPQFLRAVRNIKFRGACARVNLALGELPSFTSLPGDGPHLHGLISISPSLDYLERAYDDAKYGEPSRRPYLEALIPSLTDPSLAPPGKHILSVFVQYTPYHLKAGSWDDARREALGRQVIETLAEYAPNLTQAVLHSQVLTPLDLERTYGLTEGNIYHGELTLDQLFFMRPVPGWAQYRTPIQGLYLCGAGAHPGGGVSGAPGFNAAREVLKDVKRET